MCRRSFRERVNITDKPVFGGSKLQFTGATQKGRPEPWVDLFEQVTAVYDVISFQSARSLTYARVLREPDFVTVNHTQLGCSLYSREHRGNDFVFL